MPFKIILGIITLIKNDILSKTFSTPETTSFSEAIFFSKQPNTRRSFYKCHKFNLDELNQQVTNYWETIPLQQRSIQCTIK